MKSARVIAILGLLLGAPTATAQQGPTATATALNECRTVTPAVNDCRTVTPLSDCHVLTPTPTRTVATPLATATASATPVIRCTVTEDCPQGEQCFLPTP